MILELALSGAAGFLFLRGFWHAGGLTRLIFAEPPPQRVIRSSTPGFDHDAHELALFRDTGAWWLDPNRWGPVPTVVAKAIPNPRCPHCTARDMLPFTQYGSRVELWRCPDCGLEWVPVGIGGFTESKLSRRRRKMIRGSVHLPTLPQQLQQPPGGLR